MSATIPQLIINPPYEEPRKHWKPGSRGGRNLASSAARHLAPYTERLSQGHPTPVL